MKTVTLRTSIPAQVLALMCTAEFCPFTMDAFECPFGGSVDCSEVEPRHWEAIMKEEADEPAGDRG